MSRTERPKTKLVPVPATNIIPERDVSLPPILEARHLGIDFGGLSAVSDFNFAIGRTEIAGLIGPNGAGKTTVFNLLTKVYQPTRGTILLDGMDTAGKTTIQVNQMGIARTFQNIRLFRDLSVLDNVLVGLHNETKYSLGTAMFRLAQGAHRKGARAGASQHFRHAGYGRQQGGLASVWRAAKTRDRPRTGDESVPAAA